MAIAVQDLSTLDPVLVAQFDTELTTLLQEFNPDIELRIGTLHDLLLHLHAILDAATQTNIDRIRQSNSLQQVTADPTLADPGVVDALLSNYNITRHPGSRATGTITIVLNQLITTIIPSGSVFTISGVDFAPEQTFAGRTAPAAVIDPTDVLIEQTDVSEFSFSIPITAVNIGANGNVSMGATVTPASPPPKFITAYAQSDFTGGANEETNEEMIARLAGGAAVTAWANRVSIDGLIRKQEDFALVENMSIIGFGDPEMLRDEHSVWPGHTGGRVDIYLRSQELYQSLLVPVTGTLIAKVGPLGTWQASLGLDDAPGFYKVDKVLLPSMAVTDPGFAVTSDSRFLDLITPTLPPPDLDTVVEGVYSRYQTGIFEWDDTVTDATSLPLLSTQDYNLIVLVMPLIGDIQDFLNGRSQRPPTGDVLVKAPIPCFTEVTFTVNYDSDTDAPDTVEIQNTVSSAVNNLVFPGSLASSFISQVLHDLLPNLVSVISMSLAGSIRRPDATLVPLADPEQIDIPNDPTNMITGRTTVFFLRPEDVNVTLVAVDIPDV